MYGCPTGHPFILSFLEKINVIHILSNQVYARIIHTAILYFNKKQTKTKIIHIFCVAARNKRFCATHLQSVLYQCIIPCFNHIPDLVYYLFSWYFIYISNSNLTFYFCQCHMITIFQDIEKRLSILNQII